MKWIAALAALGCVALAQPASALPYCLDQETLTVGTVESGSSSNLCACDGTVEILKEALQNGKAKLQVKWTFPGVQPGNIKLHFKGTRPNNSDGDNFQFYYTTNPNGNFGVLIPGAIIDHSFAPADGVTIDLETTTSEKTFTVFLADTATNDTNLDTVSLDCVQIDDGNND